MTRFLLAATIVLAAGRTFAEDPTPKEKYGDPHQAFAQADTNRDGVIDHAEYQERITEIFFFADKNKDGRVSLHEFLRVRFKDFEKADKNDDGVLEIDEVVATYEDKGK